LIAENEGLRTEIGTFSEKTKKEFEEVVISYENQLATELEAQKRDYEEALQVKNERLEVLSNQVSDFADSPQFSE